MTEAVAVGFFGKIPSRGDFVRAGLSRDFTLAWDDWLQAVLPACRCLIGENWDTVWRGTRPWRFALPSGQCGPRPILGLFMPSVDRAGRCFPLTIAAEGAVDGICFLDGAEPIGLDAVAGAYARYGVDNNQTQTPTLDYRVGSNQQVRIDIMDPSGQILGLTTATGLLQNIFETTPTTGTTVNMNLTADLTAVLGKLAASKLVRLRITVVNSDGRLLVGIDNVKLTALFSDATAPTSARRRTCAETRARAVAGSMKSGTRRADRRQLATASC